MKMTEYWILCFKTVCQIDTHYYLAYTHHSISAGKPKGYQDPQVLFKMYSSNLVESEWLTPDQVDFSFSHLQDDEIISRIRAEKRQAEISEEQDIVDARDAYFDKRMRFFERFTKEPIKKMLIEAEVPGAFKSLKLQPLIRFAAKSNYKIEGHDADVPYAGKVLKYFNEDGSRKSFGSSSRVARKGVRVGDMWVDVTSDFEDELEDHNGVDGHVSKASHHTLEDATVVSSSTSGLPGATTLTLIQEGTDSMPTAMDAESQIKTPCQIQQSAAPGSSHKALEDAAVEPAALVDSSSTSGLPSATTATPMQEDADLMPTAMDAKSQVKTPCQIQQNAAPGSSRKALEDAAVEPTAVMDSSSTSGLPGASIFTLEDAAVEPTGADSIPTAMAPVVSSSTSGSPGATTVAVTLGDVDSKGKRESDNASKQTKQEDRGTCYFGQLVSQQRFYL
jgi:hypothetical protein